MEDKEIPQRCRKYKPEKMLVSKIHKELNDKKRKFQMGQVFGPDTSPRNNTHRKSPMGKQK